MAKNPVHYYPPDPDAVDHREAPDHGNGWLVLFFLLAAIAVLYVNYGAQVLPSHTTLRRQWMRGMIFVDQVRLFLQHPTGTPLPVLYETTRRRACDSLTVEESDTAFSPTDAIQRSMVDSSLVVMETSHRAAPLRPYAFPVLYKEDTSMMTRPSVFHTAIASVTPDRLWLREREGTDRFLWTQFSTRQVRATYRSLSISWHGYALDSTQVDNIHLDHSRPIVITLLQCPQAPMVNRLLSYGQQASQRRP